MTEELLDVPYQFFSSDSVKVKKLATSKRPSYPFESTYCSKFFFT